ncbi:uncharacterized protein METZ01_LOCUS249572, partial [marine metagenome]
MATKGTSLNCQAGWPCYSVKSDYR